MHSGGTSAARRTHLSFAMHRLVVVLLALAAALAAPAPSHYAAVPVGFAAPINPIAVRPPPGHGVHPAGYGGYNNGGYGGYNNGGYGGYNNGYGGYNNGYGGYNGGYPSQPVAPVGFAAPINPAVVASSQGPYGYTHQSAIVGRSVPYVDAVVTHAAAPVAYATPVAYAPSHSYYH